MIYCVVPRELEDELFEKLVEYYKDNPNVTVIVDRREGRDRRQDQSRRKDDEFRGQRQVRDRRHHRIPDTFPDVESAG